MDGTLPEASATPPSTNSRKPAAAAPTWWQELVPWRSHPGVPERPFPGSIQSTITLILLLAATYLGLGMFAFSMAVQNANVTCQAFFPEGISLVCVILFGPRVAPGIFLGQFFLALYTGLPPGPSAIIALVNSLQGILGGHLFWRWRISPLLHRPRDIARLLVLCALVVQPISATGGIIAQYFLFGLPAEKIGSVWLYWWAGNVLGQLLVLPLVLTSLQPRDAHRDAGEIRRALTVVGLYYLPVALFVFGDWGDDGPIYRLLIFSAFYLPLIWLAVQSRVRTIAIANLLLTAPFLVLINAGPDLARFFSNQNQHLCADIVIMAGIVSSLLLAALWEQLRNRTLDLREANAARERLFSIIGHDLNAPVANLKTYLDLLSEGRLTEDGFRSSLDDLRRGVDHAHVTLRNLMDWGSHQRASIQPRSSEVPLRAAADEAIALLSLIADEKRIRIRQEIPAEAIVRADIHQVHSLLRNLISNAVKFTPENGEITLSASSQGRSWTTYIRDTGIGMSADRAEQLFDPQSAFISTRGTAGERGLGLGLQLCADFIKLNHGTITAESSPSGGTQIRFTLPTG